MSTVHQAATYVQQPVSDVFCERVVVGTLLSYRDAYDKVGDILTEDCFKDGICQSVFSAIREMINRGLTADLITIPSYMERMGDGPKVTPVDLVELANGSSYYDIREKSLYLQELSKRRRLLIEGLRLIDAGTKQDRSIDEVLYELNGTLDHLNDNAVTRITSTHDALKDLKKSIEENQSDEGQVYDYSGIQCFDERAFLRPEALNIIAAYSGNGKSCLATSVAYNCASTGVPIAYYSLEMNKKELIARTIARICEIPTERLLYHKMSKTEMKRFDMAAVQLDALPLFFDERATISIETLLMSIRQMVRQKHIKGVIIDYLQILSQTGKPKNQTDEAFLGEVVRNFKNVAKQMGIWIILLSQISRNRESTEPKDSYLRGSGQILETCDNCVLLYRPSKYEGAHYSGTNMNVNPMGTAELNICKTRNGSDNMRYIVAFEPEYTYFHDIEIDQIPYLDGVVNTQKVRTYFTANSDKD